MELEVAVMFSVGEIVIDEKLTIEVVDNATINEDVLAEVLVALVTVLDDVDK